MKKHTNHNERLSGVSKKTKVNNSIAATEVKKNLYTDIWKNSDSVICFQYIRTQMTIHNDEK